MNERIRAHDLWTQVCQEDMPELDETYMTMRRTRKFAELIIKECLMIVYERQVQAPTDDDGYFKVATDMVSTDIKLHFGVEE